MCDLKNIYCNKINNSFLLSVSKFCASLIYSGGICPGSICPGGICFRGYSVQGVRVQEESVQGVYVLGVSVQGVHVWEGYVLEPYKCIDILCSINFGGLVSPMYCPPEVRSIEVLPFGSI